MNDELEKLRKKHAEEEAALLQELEIKAALPDMGVPWRLHVYPLYGAVGSAKIEYGWFDYGKEKPQPSLDTVRLAAGLLPPEPLVKVKDGCLSFRPKAHVESLPEEKKSRWQEEQEIAPFTVKVSAFQRQSAEVEWNTRLKSGKLLRVEIVVPLPDKLGRFRIERQRGPLAVEQAITRCEFNVETARVHTLFDGPEPVAELAQPIRWAAGDVTTPNDFTLYWVELRDDWRPTTAARLVEALA